MLTTSVFRACARSCECICTRLFLSWSSFMCLSSDAAYCYCLYCLMKASCRNITFLSFYFFFPSVERSVSKLLASSCWCKYTQLVYPRYLYSTISQQFYKEKFQSWKFWVFLISQLSLLFRPSHLQVSEMKLRLCEVGWALRRKSGSCGYCVGSHSITILTWGFEIHNFQANVASQRQLTIRIHSLMHVRLLSSCLLTGAVRMWFGLLAVLLHITRYCQLK